MIVGELVLSSTATWVVTCTLVPRACRETPHPPTDDCSQSWLPGHGATAGAEGGYCGSARYGSNMGDYMHTCFHMHTHTHTQMHLCSPTTLVVQMLIVDLFNAKEERVTGTEVQSTWEERAYG